MLFVNLCVSLIIYSVRGSTSKYVCSDVNSNVTTNEIYKDVRSLYYVERMVQKWAPLVWLAPGEKFFPVEVTHFLRYVTVPTKDGEFQTLPIGPKSEHMFLVTKSNIDDLLQDPKSILYGQNPNITNVPVYAFISECGCQHFHVTYWFFFPYSQGKTMCTLDMGLLGPVPIPHFNNQCFGSLREYGSHVGDWEHTSFMFKGKEEPEEMYVSAHDAGAFYKYDSSAKVFVFSRQEIRKGFIQRPTFPPTVTLFTDKNGFHPILFAARGSHGLWTAPGKHKYVRLPRLYDVSGYGTPWKTWNQIEMLNINRKLPQWMYFLGKWGNPREKCHPLSRMGINICQITDGPSGIPKKRQNFVCDETPELATNNVGQAGLPAGFNKIRPIPKAPCTFCAKLHHPWLCLSLPTLEARRAKVKSLHLCSFCLQPHAGDCKQKEAIQCKWTECLARGEHHTALCPAHHYPVVMDQVMAWQRELAKVNPQRQSRQKRRN